MKRIAFLLAVLFAFTLGANAQIDEEGGQFFGGSRSISKAYSVFDFGTIKAPVTHQFIIRNTSPNPMVITNIDMPAGVSVTVLSKTIKPMSEGKIIVTIDPKLFPKDGAFELPLIVTTEQNLHNGQVIKTTSVYKLKGVINK